MTIKDAIKCKISRVKKNYWAFSDSYVKLDFYEDGMCGPWASLYSRTEQTLIKEPTPQKFLLIFGDTESDWEEYLGEIDPDEEQAILCRHT